MERIRTSCKILGDFIPELRRVLREEHYRAKTITLKMGLVAKLDRWLTQQKVSLNDFNPALGGRFLEFLRTHHPAASQGAKDTLQRLLSLLSQAGIIGTQRLVKESRPVSAAERFTCNFRNYLKLERGPDDHTIYNYSRHVLRFLSDFFQGGVADLREC